MLINEHSSAMSEAGTRSVATGSLRIAVGIATAGRAKVLADTLDHISRQTRQPDEILVCPADPGDVDCDRIAEAGMRIQIVAGERGLPSQRNALMSSSSADIMVFLDDDFLMASDFLAEVAALMETRREVVVATGHVLADGILTRGLEYDEAVAIIDASGPNMGGQVRETYNAYGCNMVIRLEPVRAVGLRFDERLPLYAWQEDLDFSRQLAPYGLIVHAPRLRGVHLGTKRAGRSPGRRLGYSQIVNPVYLAKKGTMEWRRCGRQILRNVLANTVHSLRPEPWVDRRGRLLGNLIGVLDVARGISEPERTIRF